MPGCQFSMGHCKLQNTVLESKIDLFVLIKEKRYLVLNNHDLDGKAKKRIVTALALLDCGSLFIKAAWFYFVDRCEHLTRLKKRKPINNIQCTHLIRDEHTFNNLFCFSCLMEKSVLDKKTNFFGETL